MPRAKPAKRSPSRSLKLPKFSDAAVDRIAKALGIEGADDREILRDGLNETAERHHMMAYFREGPTAGQVKAAIRVLRRTLAKAQALAEDLPLDALPLIQSAYRRSAVLGGLDDSHPRKRLHDDLWHLRRLHDALTVAEALESGTCIGRKGIEGNPEVREALASLFRTYEALYGESPKIRKRRDPSVYEGPLFEFIRACTRTKPLKIHWNTDQAMGTAIGRELRRYRQFGNTTCT